MLGACERSGESEIRGQRFMRLIRGFGLVYLLAGGLGWPPAGGQTAGVGKRVINLKPGMSLQALESALERAPRGANIQFGPGIYDLADTLVIPCKDLHLNGPQATPPTAVLSAAFRNDSLLRFNGGCGELGSIKYLHFQNAGAVYFGIGNNSNFVFEHNLVTRLPSGLSNAGAESGLFFDGSLATTLTNVMIQYNTFGDSESCVAVFETPKDEGGYCSGIITSQGEDRKLTIQYNNFVHVENGIHLNQLAAWAPGNKNSICIGCSIEYNSILNYHRIGIEVQVSTPEDPVLVKHNAIVDPIHSSWGTFAVSMACCQWSRLMGTPGHTPGYIFDDNVLVATQPIGSGCPPYGVEFWGNGPQGTNSLVQGTFCHGYTWGWGAGPWLISNNYICGPNFAGKGGYITNQQKQSNQPLLSRNTVAAKCSSTLSKAPAISPPGGVFSGAYTVTLTDAGANTGIWYTTDGSTPSPGSGTAKYYAGPLTLTGPATVKAVGMWGAPNQPLRYPAGYGYVPSNVVVASYGIAPERDKHGAR